AYVALWGLTLVRLERHFHRVVMDFTDHRRGPGFFTTVAGTCVLGMEAGVVRGRYEVAIVLWCVGTVLWLVLTYTFFTAVTVRATKPSLEQGISGSWLNVVVATQSVSALGTFVAVRLSRHHNEMLFAALAMFLLGCMLYMLIIGLILYRFLFFTMEPREFTPPYWIDMGAEAITTLAGAMLVTHAADSLLLQGFLPFLKGFTLFFWVTGTWWIPLLVILTIWRHLWKHDPLKYDPRYWSMVFPLGMYTACTWELAKSTHLEFLAAIPQYFIFVALLAWVVTLGGMIHAIVRGTTRGDC
ncbi:MAG TPA: tellurite resistance/C4-dicarboxylate transporter family protein, partial [Verrucomicrobiae bacterium]|nr:tellurite resistance/C4-dicarboxylate transporter family protein [Verrucomicrobiae bacterium]